MSFAFRPPLSSTSPVAVVYLERKLRESIKHASLICPGYEDTKECKIAWNRVDDIQRAIHMTRDREAHEREVRRQQIQCEIDPLACREYDV